MTRPSRYLLSGRPGVGKTTLLRKSATGLSGLAVGGFFTQEIRENGQRVGFGLTTFEGQSGVLAHVDNRSGPRVGKYRVDCDTFDRIGVQALESALSDAAVILIDEIGKMELLSSRFRMTLAAVFDVEKPLVATIMAHPLSLTDALKQRPDVQLVEVTLENRDELANEIAAAIQGYARV